MSKTAPIPTASGTSIDLLETYLKNNSVPPEKLESVIKMFSGLSASAAAATAVRAPAARAERPVAPAKAPAKTSAKSAKATEAVAPAKASTKKKAVANAKTAKKAKAKTVKPEAKASAAVDAVAKAAARRKQVARAGNNGSIVIDVAIPTKSLKSGKVSRRKFLGIRQANDPAVPINQSVLEDHIVCLEDGKKFKMMKRWLRATYGMSPEEYKAKWGLPEDYPMVAPGYAREKSDYAKIQGLGTAENKQHKSPTVRELNQAVR
jgi:predicted transcriptional regulator